MQSVKAPVVAYQHIDASESQLSHDLAVTKQGSYPKCINSALVLDVDVYGWIHQHHFNHLQISFCHGAEERVLGKLLSVELAKIEVNFKGAAEVVKHWEVELLNGVYDFALNYGAESRQVLVHHLFAFVNRADLHLKDAISINTLSIFVINLRNVWVLVYYQWSKSSFVPTGLKPLQIFEVLAGRTNETADTLILTQRSMVVVRVVNVDKRSVFAAIRDWIWVFIRMGLELVEVLKAAFNGFLLLSKRVECVWPESAQFLGPLSIAVFIEVSCRLIGIRILKLFRFLFWLFQIKTLLTFLT